MPEEKPEEMVEQFQIYQQQLQNVLIQKEGLKMQSMEIDRAIEELDKTNQKTAYKITGQIMISKPVEELKKDLNETKETIEVRIKGLEKTEERMVNKLKELQEKLKDVIKE
jgi:prefoldin beta subunit